MSDLEKLIDILEKMKYSDKFTDIGMISFNTALDLAILEAKKLINDVE